MVTFLEVWVWQKQKDQTRQKMSYSSRLGSRGEGYLMSDQTGDKKRTIACTRFYTKNGTSRFYSTCILLHLKKKLRTSLDPEVVDPSITCSPSGVPCERCNRAWSRHGHGATSDDLVCFTSKFTRVDFGVPMTSTKQNLLGARRARKHHTLAPDSCDDADSLTMTVLFLARHVAIPQQTFPPGSKFVSLWLAVNENLFLDRYCRRVKEI
jgi:hypothetical protein